MHSIAQTQKILTFMSSTGEYRQRKHTQHASCTKTECDYLNGCIKKKTVTYTKISPKLVTSRYKAGNAEEEVTVLALLGSKSQAECTRGEYTFIRTMAVVCVEKCTIMRWCLLQTKGGAVRVRFVVLIRFDRKHPAGALCMRCLTTAGLTTASKCHVVNRSCCWCC